VHNRNLSEETRTVPPLSGVAWRILLGEDAKRLDTQGRAKTEAAYDYAELFSALAEEPPAGTP
jgi:hypothetical protein